MRRLFAALGLVAIGSATGCACPSVALEAPTRIQAAAEPAELMPGPAFNVSAYAEQFYRPAHCVGAARRMKSTAPSVAWELIKACVARGGFTALRELLDGAWDDELQSRPEAPELLTRIIAMRGGGVNEDIRLLHSRRVPLFSLAEASASPDAYRGRLVVMLARVDNPLSKDGRLVWLTERALASRSSDVEIAPATQTVSRASGTSTFAGNHQSTVDTMQVQKSRRYYNLETETGREALAHLDVADPFFDLDDTFVVLARFDGVKTFGPSHPNVPELSVLGFLRPAALLTF